LSAAGQRRWTQRPAGSNWGDFGPDDQRGRMNLITPEKRLAALREVQDGEVFVLSLPLDYPGGEDEHSPRKAPRLIPNKLGGNSLCNMALTETDLTCDDTVLMSLQYSTQWDALVHWGRKFDVDGSGETRGVYYNGYRAHEHVKCDVDGSGFRAEALGIENMAETGVQGRGVLVNLVKAFGRERQWIDHDMLMQAMADQKVEVREGDMLLLYTGYGDALMAANRQPDEAELAKVGAVLKGADERLLDWIETSGVSAVISDNQAVEGFDLANPDPGANGMLPLHDRCLFKLGVHLGELWWLSDLAQYLDERGRHAFLLTAPPLRLPGAAGSPATPVATV
jgi:kynurenine formamidase